jgi:hypothetical protein
LDTTPPNGGWFSKFAWPVSANAAIPVLVLLMVVQSVK